jgi:putative SOS response-associated peptidase YedK
MTRQSSAAIRDRRAPPQSAEVGPAAYCTKEPIRAQHPINARSETAAKSGMFRRALKQRRYLAPDKAEQGRF